MQGANCVLIFYLSSPRWLFRRHKNETIRSFAKEQAKRFIGWLPVSEIRATRDHELYMRLCVYLILFVVFYFDFKIHVNYLFLVYFGNKPLYHASHSLLQHLSLKHGNMLILQGYIIPRTSSFIPITQLEIYSNERKLGNGLRLLCTHHSDCTTAFLADNPPDYRKVHAKVDAMNRPCNVFSKVPFDFTSRCRSCSVVRSRHYYTSRR